jgi:hypothetical protein
MQTAEYTIATAMPESAVGRSWYIYEAAETFGPFTYPQMLRLEREGRLADHSLTAEVGKADWVPWMENCPVERSTPTAAQVSEVVGLPSQNAQLAGASGATNVADLLAAGSVPTNVAEVPSGRLSRLRRNKG